MKKINVKLNIKRCDLKSKFSTIKVGITENKIQYKNTTLNIVFDISAVLLILFFHTINFDVSRKLQNRPQKEFQMSHFRSFHYVMSTR